MNANTRKDWKRKSEVQQFISTTVPGLIVAALLLSFAPTGLASQELHIVAFPESLSQQKWHVEFFLPAERLAPNSGTARIAIRDADGRTVFEKSWDAASSRSPSVAADLHAGTYSIEVSTYDTTGGAIWQENTNLTLASMSRTALSDLVPVELPGIERPKASRVMWQPTPGQSHFFLYYEVHTSSPDTVVNLKSIIEDASGQVVFDDAYTLFVYNHRKSDYLRVDTASLPDGVYTVKLVQEGAPEGRKEKRFVFAIEDGLTTFDRGRGGFTLGAR